MLTSTLGRARAWLAASVRRSSGVLSAGIALVLLCAVVPRASAQAVVVSNLGEAPSGFNPNLYRNSVHGAQTLASSFTTGAEAMSLSKITIAFAGGFSGEGLFSVSLHTDNGSVGSLIETLVGDNSPVAPGLYDYSSPGAVMLAPNTTYWWWANTQLDEGGQYALVTTASLAESGAAGWTIGDALRVGNSSNVFRLFPDLALQFSVTASAVSAVPEPGTYAALAGLSALLFAVYRRGRKIDRV